MFTPNQVKGNWGEMFVAEQLAAHGCLVRSAPQGHDSGIDLYCESLDPSGEPFLHFWCQVKTGNFPPKQPVQSIRVSNRHLRYWSRQPIPVFVVLVSERSFKDRRFYICSVAHNLLAHKRNRLRKSVLLTSRYSVPPFDLNGFFREFLPTETVLWNLQHGKLSSIPEYKRNGKLKSFLVGVTAPYEGQLRSTLHYSLWRLAEDILREDWSFDSLTPKGSARAAARALQRARPYINALDSLAQGRKLPHQNYITIGMLAEIDGEHNHSSADLSKAMECYKTALALMRMNGVQQHKNYKLYRKYLARAQARRNALRGRLANRSSRPRGHKARAFDVHKYVV